MVWLSCEGETPADTENMGEVYYTPWRVGTQYRENMGEVYYTPWRKGTQQGKHGGGLLHPLEGRYTVGKSWVSSTTLPGG